MVLMFFLYLLFCRLLLINDLLVKFFRFSSFSLSEAQEITRGSSLLCRSC